jgi:protein transport protein SEC31
LAQKADTHEPPQSYKLAALYDHYFEYADILSSQGLVKEAARFLDLTPAGYKGSTPDSDLESDRKRFGRALDPAPVSTTTGPSRHAVPAPTLPKTTYSGYTGFVSSGPTVMPHQPVTHASYEPSSTVTNPYVPAQQPIGHGSTVLNHQNRQHSLAQPPNLRSQQAHISSIPPPPHGHNGTPSNANVSATPPPPPKRDAGGWNDAPVVAPNRAPAALNLNKPQAITSPFPNSPAYSPQGSPYMSQGSATLAPPPPRPGSVNRGPIAPSGGIQRIRSPDVGPGAGVHPPQARPPSTTGRMAGPQTHLVSPPQGHTPSQYAPPSRFMARGQTPPPAGPPSTQRPMPQAGGPYGPPGVTDGLPAQQYQHQPAQAGPYDRPPGQQPSGPPMQGPPSLQAGPPPPPPPGGPARVASRAGTLAKPQTVAPKYPPGDRSHIPDYARPAYQSISEHLNRLKQTVPASQKRVVDDLERRINPLFDSLNCETLSRPVVDQLVVLTRAMDARDRANALSIHVDLLTRGSQTDDIGMWMSGVKQLIMRL